MIIIKLSQDEYKKLYQQQSPATPSLKTVPRAFVCGGAICAFGQGLLSLYTKTGLENKQASALVSCTLIFIGVLLTSLRIFEYIAKFAGAGTLVPITGFANSVASPAIEFRDEGFITGTCIKMFTIAGPVIVCGVTASAIYGLIYWLIR